MGKARCPANQFLHDRVRKALTLAELQRQETVVFGYRRALRSLEAYPVPIVSLRQAAALEGVGMKLLAVLDETLTTHYASWMAAPLSSLPPLDDSARSSQRVNLGVPEQLQAQASVDAPEPSRTRVTTAEAELLQQLGELQARHHFRQFFARGELIGRRKPQKLFDALVGRGLLHSLEIDGERRYRVAQPLASQTSPPTASQLAPAEPQAPLLLAAAEVLVRRVFLNVDNRERNAPQALSFEEKLALNGVRVKRRNLPLGDFLWTAEVDCESGQYEYVLDAIVERKTVDDLARSIVDGRLHDQRHRLRGCGLARRYLLVEGSTDQAGSALCAAANSARVLDDLRVVRAVDVKASADWLTRVTQALERELAQTLAGGSCRFQTSFAAFAKAQRRAGNFTVGNAAHNALKQLRGFGEESAQQVLAVCPTLSALSAALGDPLRAEHAKLRQALNTRQMELLLGVFTRTTYVCAQSQP